MKLKHRVTLEVASLRGATKYIIENHYLHRGRTMAQLPYWILFDGKRVGVLLFSYPRLSVPFQDIPPMNLIEFARMFIEPSVQGIQITDSDGKDHVLAIATCAIGKSLRCIRQDWHNIYPHVPDILACVSWADTEYHTGTIYKAANFELVGESGGSVDGKGKRPNGGEYKGHEDYKHKKLAFIYRWKKPLRLAEQYRERHKPTHEQVGLF